MKLTPPYPRIRARRHGWALLAVITVSACAILLLASVMQWADSNAAITARNNETFAAAYAAEAATEKVLATMSQQYQNYGFSLINSNMNSYITNYPTQADGTYWTNFQFGSGNSVNQLIVSASATGVTNVIGNNSPYAMYAGLTFVGNTYQIIANAQNTNTMYHIVSTVGQQISFGTIPLFQFAIFYQGDLEMAPGAAMTVSGPVHGNGNIYLDPQSTLVFSNNISAAENIYTNQSPLDLSIRTFGSVTFDGLESSGVPPLNLPVGTNTDSSNTNVNQNVYGILQLPQASQTPSSATGSNLLYNQADMIIIISNNNTISVTSGAGVNNQATVISNSQWQFFMNTNGTFTDQRDNLPVNQLVLNVSNLVLWSATNTVLNPVLASVRPGQGNVQSIYVADMRGTSNSTVTCTNAYGTNYSTNAVTSASLPSAGTYVPPITSTNTTSTNSSSFPGSGTYLPPITSTNTTTTTNTYAQGTPANGTFLGTITTNTTLTTNSSSPSPGTYTGTVTHSGSHYIYNKITGYTFNMISGYTYNKITGYTYQGIIASPWTNTICVTNWTITSQPGIVLSNGAALPPQGLSIATPDPAYIIGNWNIKLTNTSSAPSDAGLNDTTYARPSAIYADAVTILSPSWNPANSTAGISSRAASSDTVNAAFLTGNVPSDGNDDNGEGYSGGVENFARFLENWSGQTFTYNGSMVQMFTSQIATNEWPNTGTVYNPPTRHWAFDNNFSNPAKQPPMTPKMIAVQRSQWALLTPRSTTMTNISTY